jgi:hypothetical protein
MGDKRTGPEAPGGRRRKRAAPTIELTATEVPPADAPAAPAPPDPPPEPRPAEAAAQPVSAPPPPPPEQPAPAANEEPSAEPQAAPEQPPRASGPRTYVVALAAGFVGAAIVTGVLVALWYAGLRPLRSNDQSAQIKALQAQVRALQNRPPAADRKAIDALQARVEQIAGEIAKLPPGDKTVAERLTAADNALKSLGIALTVLNHRNDDIAADAKQARDHADAAEKAVSELRASLQNVAKNASGAVPAAALDSLQTRVAALERSVQEARAEIAKNSTTDRAARLAVSAAALRDAVERGAPYAAELKQAKSLGADDKELAPLASFAQSGVPSKVALAHELSALMPAMLKASGNAAAPGGFLDRLQANASKLVRIQPVEAPQGDAPADVLARIEVEAAKADIDGALADLAKLPPAARAPAQGWIAQAKARQAALAAARQFATDAASALGKP